jgi:hypothetical protein
MHSQSAAENDQSPPPPQFIGGQSIFHSDVLHRLGYASSIAENDQSPARIFGVVAACVPLICFLL